MDDPLRPAQLPERMAISPKEQAQWLLHLLQPGRGVCNVGIAVRVERVLRWWPLQQALNHLLRRHAALRAVLTFDGPVPHKRFLPDDVEFPLTTDGADEETLPHLLAGKVAEPFELGPDPLIRAHLVLLPESTVVLFVAHHLVMDYISTVVVMTELPKLYDAFAADRPVPAELAGTAPIHLEPPVDQSVVDYWIKHLDGVDPGGMALPGAKPIVGRPTMAGARIERRMSSAAVAAVARLQAGTKVTQNLILLAAFYLLLARHGVGPAVVVGIPVTGRRRLSEGVVGFHTKTLPVRVDVADEVRVEELVQRVFWSFLEGLEHDDASFEDIQTVLAARSADWRVPVFRHSFNYRPIKEDNLHMADLPIRVYEVHNAMSRLDMEWIFYGSDEKIEMTMVYSTEVHDAAFVLALVERYDAMLVDLADTLAGGRPIGGIAGWSDRDRVADRALNTTATPVGVRTVVKAFADRATAHPDAPAVRTDGRTVTYGELKAKADTVATALRARDVRRGEPVALLAARGPDLLAAALGVWAVGAAYLPLDPEHPPVRLADQIDDAGVRFVLADAAVPAEVAHGRHVLDLAATCAGNAHRTHGTHGSERLECTDSRDHVQGVVDLDDLAYVIYTSGSSGRPKGVEVTHGNLANLVHDFAGRLGFGSHERILWLTTFSFDISALEVFLPLVVGGTVVVADDRARVNGVRLLDLVVAEDIGVVQATPTTWRHVAGELAGHLAGRRVLCGGEPLSATLAERLLADGCRLFNVYGPTETTIWSTTAELTSPVPDPVPIGVPIADTTVRVCTPQGRAVPRGVPGELWIGGTGVARGYRGRPDATAERFRDVEGAGRFYRTGDEVRHDGDALVFLGRLDRQVKVRGHRLEPAEIEGVLESHPAVRAAAVVTEPDGSGHLRLVAALIPVHGKTIDEGDLRDHAAARLPGAAVPGRFVVLDELPMTGNDKVDHRAVTRLVADNGAPVELPDDPTLRRLVMLWREVLGDNRLGPDANLFLSGGHSLLAATLADRLAAAFGATVGFDTVFDAPSPRQFQTWLMTREGVR